jgi:hypothetical protein
MATDLFAIGELEQNIIAMIAKFKSNSGGTYSNPLLTKHVRDHDSTKRFVNNRINDINRVIKKYNGDVNKIIPNIDIVIKERPRYGTRKDIIMGLTIAINDTWASKVELIEYNLNGRSYSGKIKITLYDHFGLDQPDVDKKFGLLAGFRSWFILQHLDRFAYKHFIKVIYLEYQKTGKI